MIGIIPDAHCLRVLSARVRIGCCKVDLRGRDECSDGGVIRRARSFVCQLVKAAELVAGWEMRSCRSRLGSLMVVPTTATGTGDKPVS